MGQEQIWQLRGGENASSRDDLVRAKAKRGKRGKLSLETGKGMLQRRGGRGALGLRLRLLGPGEPLPEHRERCSELCCRSDPVSGCCGAGDRTPRSRAGEPSRSCLGAKSDAVAQGEQGWPRGFWLEGLRQPPGWAGIQEPWPTASPSSAHGPTTPGQEGVGVRAAAKEKWVWGGGCGCECGCVVRGWGGREPREEGGPNRHPHHWWCQYCLGALTRGQAPR